jgi:hypothetical protein
VEGYLFFSKYVYNMDDIQFLSLVKAARKEILIIFISEHLCSALLVKSDSVPHCSDICLASLFVSSKLHVFLTDVNVPFLS